MLKTRYKKKINLICSKKVNANACCTRQFHFPWSIKFCTYEIRDLIKSMKCCWSFIIKTTPNVVYNFYRNNICLNNIQYDGKKNNNLQNCKIKKLIIIIIIIYFMFIILLVHWNAILLLTMMERLINTCNDAYGKLQSQIKFQIGQIIIKSAKNIRFCAVYSNVFFPFQMIWELFQRTRYTYYSHENYKTNLCN